MNSCHLLFRWAWLHFKTLNLNKGSPYLRDEGHELKLKIITPRQASKDQHRLKERIEKERIEKKGRNVNCGRNGSWRKIKGRKDKDDGEGSREIRCLIKGHPCLVAFVYESTTLLYAKDGWRNSSYQQAFTRIKQGSNSVRDNVCKKYYLIFVPQTLVIFFWHWHGFILKRSILIKVPFIWGMRDMKWSWKLWHQDKSVRINIGW